MNLKRVLIRNEIFIRRDLSIPQLNLLCKHELSLKCRLGLKLNPDSCKLPPSVNSIASRYVNIVPAKEILSSSLTVKTINF